MSFTYKENKTGINVAGYVENETGITITGYEGDYPKDLVIPEEIDGKNVTTIYFGAFEHNELTSVIIPDTVTNIVGFAFRNNNLTSIVIPDSVTHIGTCAFDDNKNLTEITYKGEKLKTQCVDGYCIIIDSEHKKQEHTIYNCRYFVYNCAYSSDDFQQCYVSEKDGFTSYGLTVNDAIEDVNFKILRQNTNIDELVKEIKESDIITIKQYKILTGASSFDVNKFKVDNNITTDSLPLSEVKEMVKWYYKGDKFIELFS